MITVKWPCTGFVITSTWQQHLQRPGYPGPAYAGTDLARGECPLYGSQYGGQVVQAHMSPEGYGYTTFVKYFNADGEQVMLIRNAHQKNLYVRVGDLVGPDTVLGIMDSTGNSTGTHTHYETWLRINGVWQNVDPLNERFGLKMVYDKADLEPLTGEIPMPEPEFTHPVIPTLPRVRTTALITDWIYLRKAPFKGTEATILGRVNPGEVWTVCNYKLDSFGNTWYMVYKGDKCGWCAAHYGGKQWLEEITN